MFHRWDIKDQLVGKTLMNHWSFVNLPLKVPPSSFSATYIVHILCMIYLMNIKFGQLKCNTNWQKLVWWY